MLRDAKVSRNPRQAQVKKAQRRKVFTSLNFLPIEQRLRDAKVSRNPRQAQVKKAQRR